MIGRLTGGILVLETDHLLLDVGGVGYEIEISLNTYSQLAGQESNVTVHTHLVVRDDAHLLYGFGKQSERELFRTLIKVNGVGPKMALGILSGLEADAFAAAVRSDDVKALTALPGVGKKTAERLIIEMRDKVDAMSVGPVDAAAPRPGALVADAESALISLGYRPQDASMALSKIESPGDNVESLIRQALKQLMRK